MIKWPITYTDYSGTEYTEDFYFNLNKAEVMELNLNANGAYSEYLQQIVNDHDGPKLAEVFRTLILKSYGKKSPDGKRFIKSDAISEEFQQTEAYVNLYMELLTDADKIKKFIEGIMPKPDNNQDKPSLENHMNAI